MTTPVTERAKDAVWTNISFLDRGVSGGEKHYQCCKELLQETPTFSDNKESHHERHSVTTEDEVPAVFLSTVQRETTPCRYTENPGHKLRECDGVIQLGSTGI